MGQGLACFSDHPPSNRRAERETPTPPEADYPPGAVFSRARGWAVWRFGGLLIRRPVGPATEGVAQAAPAKPVEKPGKKLHITVNTRPGSSTVMVDRGPPEWRFSDSHSGWFRRTSRFEGRKIDAWIIGENQFHVTALGSPTRTVLLSGRNEHLLRARRHQRLRRAASMAPALKTSLPPRSSARRTFTCGWPNSPSGGNRRLEQSAAMLPPSMMVK
jgi:hypothetical protein